MRRRAKGSANRLVYEGLKPSMPPVAEFVRKARLTFLSPPELAPSTNAFLFDPTTKRSKKGIKMRRLGLLLIVACCSLEVRGFRIRVGKLKDPGAKIHFEC